MPANAAYRCRTRLPRDSRRERCVWNAKCTTTKPPYMTLGRAVFAGLMHDNHNSSSFPTSPPKLAKSEPSHEMQLMLTRS